MAGGPWLSQVLGEPKPRTPGETAAMFFKSDRFRFRVFLCFFNCAKLPPLCE
jgi:hypothetical protein